MYQSLMHTDLAAARQRELIATATDQRLARRARRARRAERANVATARVRRGWLRSSTQPAHS